jgi:hypothetical protein
MARDVAEVAEMDQLMAHANRQLDATIVQIRAGLGTDGPDRTAEQLAFQVSAMPDSTARGALVLCLLRLAGKE